MAKQIILIIFDCLRPDTANNPALMPFLNDLKKEYMSFDAHSIASATNFSMSGMFTGTVPLEIENTWHITEKKEPVYLPKKLNKFYTQYITSNVVTCRKFGFDKGFDYFEDFLKERPQVGANRQKLTRFAAFMGNKLRKTIFYNSARKAYFYLQEFLGNNPNLNLGLKIRFKSVNDAFFNSLKKIPAGKDSFTALHFIDSHTPYLSYKIKDKNIIKEAKRLTKELYGDKGDDGEFKTFSEKDITFLKERYDEEAKDTDEQLKEMVDKLKQLNKWDETLLIITADHGEAFGETGYMKHPLGEVSNLNHIRVPFIIAGGLAKDLDIKKANNGLIWNKDIYDIILGVADGQKQIQLKENDFVRGVRKKNTVFYIHALYDPVKKEIINPVPPA